jgi:ferredoxin-NADP reductase/MOSC domain-containing protein YiiM
MLLSVNVGLPKDVGWQGRTVHTGIWKYPVDGPRMVRRLNIDGDGQGDLAGHGGEQRAVFVYQLESYEHWQKQFGRDDFTFGQFGENFTVEGLSDDSVHIGDRYRIGDAQFEVTQPRVTCFRVGMRVGVPELPALLVAQHRPGFYLRVIDEGHVQAGDEIVRTRIGRHRLTVAEIDALLYLPGRDIERLRAAVDLPALSPGWQQSFRELLETADGTANPPVDEEVGWPRFRHLRVARLVAESTTVTSIYLVADDDRPLPVPRAGQYLTLRIAAEEQRAVVRSYSISSAPGPIEYRISVKREEHGLASAYLHSQVTAGALLDVAAPRGQFVLTDETTPVLLLSAGVGATPVIAMLHQLAATRSTRDVWWIHAARDAAQHAFAAESHELLTGLPNAHEHVFYSAGPAPVGTGWIAEGRPTAAALKKLGVPAAATAYLCGPAGFMTDMARALADVGLPAARVHTELFGALPAIRPGVLDAPPVRPHQPAGPAGTGPEITFVRSGITARWSDGARSLLEFAESCDVPTRFSCRTGVCHTCETRVVTGDVTYAPTPLEAPPDGSVLLCCAQPAADMVLDL